MVRILFASRCFSRQDPQRHFARVLQHAIGRTGLPATRCKGARLGREVLALEQEGARAAMAKGADVLLDGCRTSLDGEVIASPSRMRRHVCFQDWHIDFAGSSVYYHIFRGSKVCLDQ